MIIIVAIIILGLICLLQVIELFRIGIFWQHHQNPPESWPSVSVLIAARNEALHLPKLLASLEFLDYPEEKIDFLIIDDESEDQTGEIISAWCSGHVSRKGFKSTETTSRGRRKNGKAAALAILVKEVTSEFMFFTDADCVVNPQWIKAGISAFKSQIGIVIGVTKVDANSVFGKFQELEWWNTLSQVKIAADLGLQTTGLGNNMVIRKTAYDQSGGFELTTQSLTEDLEISRLIHKSGFDLSHQISCEILAFTKSEQGIRSLLEQRKRWLSGVMTLPVFWIVILTFQFLYFPAILMLGLHLPFLALCIFGAKLTCQISIIYVLLSRTRQKLSWFYFLFFDIYSFLINALTILYYFYPSKIRWKSRNYP